MRANWTVRAVLVGAVVVAGTCMGAGPSTRPGEDEVGRLRERVRELESRNGRLEEQVRGLRTNVDSLRQALAAMGARPGLPTVVVPPPTGSPWREDRGAFELSPRVGIGATPPGAQERSFNGITYYMMPLGSTARSERRITEGAPPVIVRDPRFAPAEIAGGAK